MRKVLERLFPIVNCGYFSQCKDFAIDLIYTWLIYKPTLYAPRILFFLSKTYNSARNSDIAAANENVGKKKSIARRHPRVVGEQGQSARRNYGARRFYRVP